MSKTVLNDGDEGVLLIVNDTKAKRAKRPAASITSRSPVHVVYGGAHLFRSDTPQKLGRIALDTLGATAPNFIEFAYAMGLTGAESLPRSVKRIAELERRLRQYEAKVKAKNYAAWFAWNVYQHTVEKLQKEPVEDFRIDFEDGYGFRSDAEEDEHAIATAGELAKAYKSQSITQFCGFRVKGFGPETRDRSVRTLKLFLETLLRSTKKKLPGNFVVTLPKVTGKKEVADLCKYLKRLEKEAGLNKGSIGVELMIEHPSALFDTNGNAALRSLVDAAKGRCRSVHFGAYDYTASLGIAASHQHLRHDACNFARQMMLAALAPIGMRLSDSVTTQLPVAIHKGSRLSDAQNAENKEAIISGWRMHFNNVTLSMINGFYQSWDLHPSQLVARFAAVNAFFLETLDAQALRLRTFIEKATQATLTGNTFDDAASAQGLINFFLKGIDSGALKENEIVLSTGMSVHELRSTTFKSIVEIQRGSGG